MRLESCTIPSKGPILSLDPSPCFIIDVYLGPKNDEVFALLDSRAWACFTDKDFVKNQEIALVKKIKSVHIEVIDGRSLSSRDVTYEIVLLDVAIKEHNSIVVFNVIISFFNPIILRLSWLKKYNFQIDRCSYNHKFCSSLIQVCDSEVKVHKCSMSKPLLIDASAFMHAAKKESSFIIYAMAISNSGKISSDIRNQYQEF